MNEFLEYAISIAVKNTGTRIPSDAAKKEAARNRPDLAIARISELTEEVLALRGQLKRESRIKLQAISIALALLEGEEVGENMVEGIPALKEAWEEAQ